MTDQLRGSIHLIIGPMFSGKSSELHRQIRRSQIAGRKCWVFKHASDTRYGTDLGQTATHDGHKQACVGVTTAELKQLLRALQHRPAEATEAKLRPALLSLVQEAKSGQMPDIVGIDEGQFFKQELSPFCQYLCLRGVSCVVAGLDGDHKQDPFVNIVNLVARSETVTKLRAVCCKRMPGCHGDASFSVRVQHATPKPTLSPGSGNQAKSTIKTHAPVSRPRTDFVVGGSDAYEARCRVCI